jgi:hypothetical protein
VSHSDLFLAHCTSVGFGWRCHHCGFLFASYVSYLTDIRVFSCCGDMSQRLTPAEYTNIHLIYEFCDGFENRWIGPCGPISWLSRSPDPTPLDFFLWGVMKEMTCRTEVHTRQELLHQIWMLLRTYETPRNDSAGSSLLPGTSEAVHWNLCRVISNSYKMYLVKCSSKFIRLVLCFYLRAPWNRHSFAVIGNTTNVL